jgi:hypothetical protein
MSTRKRKIGWPITTAPTPLTPEQIQIRDRIKELEAIGIKNHHEFVAKNPNSSAARGLWFAAQYLPADLKAEWEALQKKAA